MNKETKKGKKNKYKKCRITSDSFHQQLLSELRTDAAVRRIIRDIVKSERESSDVDLCKYVPVEEYKKLQDEVERLKESNKALNDDLKKSETKINDLLKEKNDLIKEKEEELSQENEKLSKITKDCKKYKDTIDELNQKIASLKNFIDKYQVMDECFENYLKVSESRRNELEGIIYAPTVESLFACAGRKDFVKRFAEYIVKCIMREKTVSDDIMYLNNVFDTLFDVANQCEGTERYVRDKVNIGDKYSTDRFSTVGLQQGIVSDVLFYGYHSIENSEREFCKSVVEVSE